MRRPFEDNRIIGPFAQFGVEELSLRMEISDVEDDLSTMAARMDIDGVVEQVIGGSRTSITELRGGEQVITYSVSQDRITLGELVDIERATQEILDLETDGGRVTELAVSE